MTVESKRDFNADRAIIDAATAGKWTYEYDEISEDHWMMTEEGHVCIAVSREQDARFIAEARTGWPAALDRIAELEAENERLLSLVESYRNEAKAENLRACEYEGELNGYASENAQLVDEIQRYRQALESITKYPPFEETNNGDRFYEQIRETAKEALAYDEETDH